jgi:hypothetical protein
LLVDLDRRIRRTLVDRATNGRLAVLTPASFLVKNFFALQPARASFQPQSCRVKNP